MLEALDLDHPSEIDSTFERKSTPVGINQS
jgi:hypothetical protein